MDVDHFNPNKKKDKIQEYSNLFLATRHCNGAKRDRWPSNKERKAGLRFLNCCEESDYGSHIFEDPDTHRLVGITTEGKFHILNCDLNAPHLVDERSERAHLWEILENKRIRIKADFNKQAEMLALRTAAREQADRMIPKIQYLSGDALAKERARNKARNEA